MTPQLILYVFLSRGSSGSRATVVLYHVELTERSGRFAYSTVTVGLKPKYCIRASHRKQNLVHL